MSSPGSSSRSGIPGSGTLEAGNDGLLFRWDRKENFNWRLAFVLLVSFVAHLFGFYLFTVAYRPAERVLPKPARIQLLSTEAYPDKNSPDHRAAAHELARLHDRLIALQPSAVPPSQNVSIGNFAVTMRPSFADHQLRLRLPTAQSSSTRSLASAGVIPPIFDPARILLPQVRIDPASESEIAPPEQRTTPGISLEGQLAGRQLLPNTELWTSELLKMAAGNRFSFQIGVDRSGRTAHALVLEGVASEPDSAMLAAVRGLRFQSDLSDTETVWGD